jgi:hypothetical protein
MDMTEPKRTKVKAKDMLRWQDVLIEHLNVEVSRLQAEVDALKAERTRITGILAADEHGRQLIRTAQKLISWWVESYPSPEKDLTHPLTPLRIAVENYNAACPQVKPE